MTMAEASLGIVKTTLVDFPGEVAATVFTAGCNLRCPYCHNPELVSGHVPDDFLPVPEILALLRRRSNVLGGVCITGGEPLLHPWLPQFASHVHDLGLKVKVDTNGLLPGRIAAVGADYIAMDIKTDPKRYGALQRSPGTATSDPATETVPVSDALRQSIAIIREGTPGCEFRTTVIQPLVEEKDVRAIVALLEPGDRYTLTAFRPGKTLDPSLAAHPAPSADLLARYAEIARERGLEVFVREHLGGNESPSR